MLHRDHEELGAKHPLPRWLRVLLPVLTILSWPFWRWIRRTIPGRIGHLESLALSGKFREAYELAIESAPLALRRHGGSLVSRRLGKKMDRFGDWAWWLFTARAARYARHFGPEERRRVIEMLPSAPGPGGMQAADLFDEMSRWRWKESDAAGAIELSQRAIQADPTWPDAYVTLAFYAHRSGRMDPLPFLIDAVRADPGIRHHIETHFEDSPDLLAALRNAVQPS